MPTSDTVIAGLAARIYRGGAAPCPTVVYMHGGGWVGGNLSSHDYIPRRIARLTGGVVISLDYPLAPEVTFPFTFDACVSAIQAIHHSIDNHGGCGDWLAISGDSAGGNLAAASVLWCLGNEVPVAAQLLIYPILDITGHYENSAINSRYPSREQNADGPLLRAALMAWFSHRYCPDGSQSASPFASPIHSPHLNQMPPSVVAVAECDPLRDEGAAFAQRLEALDVKVNLHRGAGLIHGYFGIASACQAAEAEAERVVTDFANLLRGLRSL